MPNYKTVADYLVDPRRRDVANQTLKVVCSILQIKPPAKGWIADDDFGPKWFEQDVAGFCSKNGNEIFIHRDLKPFSIANTVVHEASMSGRSEIPSGFRFQAKLIPET